MKIPSLNRVDQASRIHHGHPPLILDANFHQPVNRQNVYSEFSGLSGKKLRLPIVNKQKLGQVKTRALTLETNYE